MAEHNEKGKFGEKLAEDYLINHDYTVLHTNWRAKRYEVDIIAQKGDILVFCEVKYRSSNFFGEPESFVTKQKQRNIIKSAAMYVGRNCWRGEVRFDIISILMKDETAKINHIENAYGCTW
ncbi:MAG: YraN family protein [Lentimicrobiaceae bacterium]|nr:YraN family protein [Lentimicrobiaceae bacterium]